MRVVTFIMLFLCFSACAEASNVNSLELTESQQLMVSEFEKFYELELVDCIVGWDTAIYQAESYQIDLPNISDQKAVYELMGVALERKTGVPLDIAQLRPNSSFHISGLYFTDGDEHAKYQGVVIDACVRQMKRIVNLLNSEAVQ